MKKTKLKLCVILLLSIGLTTGLRAQETIPVTGGEASGGGSVSYTAGQIIYTTNTGTSGSVSQGIQQPFEISVVTEVADTKRINLSVSAFPNPVTDFVTVSIKNSDTDSLLYQLFDIKGKLLISKKTEGNETHIEMSNLLPAIYFLKVVVNQKIIKIFKIIKK